MFSLVKLFFKTTKNPTVNKYVFKMHMMTKIQLQIMYPLDNRNNNLLQVSICF